MVKTFVMAARISLGWMMAQALALGMTMDPTVAAQFGTLPMEFALNAIRETWTVSMHRRKPEIGFRCSSVIFLRERVRRDFSQMVIQRCFSLRRASRYPVGDIGYTTFSELTTRIR
jgi:hypothetical protein